MKIMRRISIASLFLVAAEINSCCDFEKCFGGCYKIVCCCCIEIKLSDPEQPENLDRMNPEVTASNDALIKSLNEEWNSSETRHKFNMIYCGGNLHGTIQQIASGTNPESIDFRFLEKFQYNKDSLTNPVYGIVVDKDLLVAIKCDKHKLSIVDCNSNPANISTSQKSLMDEIGAAAEDTIKLLAKKGRYCRAFNSLRYNSLSLTEDKEDAYVMQIDIPMTIDQLIENVKSKEGKLGNFIKHTNGIKIKDLPAEPQGCKYYFAINYYLSIISVYVLKPSIFTFEDGEIRFVNREGAYVDDIEDSQDSLWDLFRDDQEDLKKKARLCLDAIQNGQIGAVIRANQLLGRDGIINTVT